MKTLRYFRETAAVYAKGTAPSEFSPFKCAVDVWRFTNSSKTGKGESRLLEIAHDKFEEYFEEYHIWDMNEGYEHDTIEKDAVTLLLNIKVGYYVYIVYTHMGIAQTEEIARGVVKW